MLADEPMTDITTINWEDETTKKLNFRVLCSVPPLMNPYYAASPLTIEDHEEIDAKIRKIVGGIGKDDCDTPVIVGNSQRTCGDSGG